MRILAAILFASGAFCAPALCDDIKGTLSRFGLIGTWSGDCSKVLSEPRAGRITFAVAPNGGASARAEDNDGEAVITTVYEITEAVIGDSDKIRVFFHPVTVTRSDGKQPSQHASDNLQIVFQRAQEKIEVIRIQFEGLPEIQRASFFERCGN
jgi:hypothetical protein